MILSLSIKRLTYEIVHKSEKCSQKVSRIIVLYPRLNSMLLCNLCEFELASGLTGKEVRTILCLLLAVLLHLNCLIIHLKVVLTVIEKVVFFPSYNALYICVCTTVTF